MRDETVTLRSFGKPIQARDVSCPFCGSRKLVVASCSIDRVRGRCNPRISHKHIRCGECRAFGPSGRRKATDEEMVRIFGLRSPSTELVRWLDHKEAREFFLARSYRNRGNRKGLRPCVFCGNADIYFYEYGVMSYRIHGICERCGAEGPWAVKRDDAKVLWNQAHELTKTWQSGFSKFLVEEKA